MWLAKPSFRNLLVLFLFAYPSFYLALAQSNPKIGIVRPQNNSQVANPNYSSPIIARKDVEPTSCTIITFGGGLGLPGGDLANRYGMNAEANLGVLFKTKSNWLYGLEFGYMFSEEIKENTLGSLVTKDGAIIGNIGRYAVIAIQQRGLKLPIFKVGKLFKGLAPKWLDQQTSGPFVVVGGGFFQHQMVFNVNAELQFLQKDKAYGYDRMCNGIALHQSVGYMMTTRNRYYGAYIAFEALEGFTQSRRYDYDLRSYDPKNRLDLVYSVKLGLMLPLFPPVENELLFE